MHHLQWRNYNFRATGPGAQVKLLKMLSRNFLWRKFAFFGHFLCFFPKFSEI